ncbi:MAG TPA: hypothetical protein VFI42_00965 [Thermomicrobiaceae bacterium]|nr:hypothetical protein [Thermomicrobiaceae bacterium]
MLEGQGIYLLAGDWHEVEPTGFIWMAPYCPQDFFCTGWGEAAYLLYKDVNRDVRFGCGAGDAPRVAFGRPLPYDR